MIYNIYAMRDELTGFLPPTYDINDAAAMRNFRVAIFSFQIVLHGIIGNSLWERIPSLLGFLPSSMRFLN